MKLEYYRDPKGNFGDDLNAWIWQELYPDLLDDDASTIFLGIGTILGSWFSDGLPGASTKVVLGSGSGKRGIVPHPSEEWRFYGVRGPLTAAYCGLDSSLVLSDPAVLLADLFESKGEAGRSGVGFMPHIWSVRHWDWRRTCEELGFEYVDPHAEAKSTIRTIGGLERLITEAMHGAIVADTLRTPWKALAISPSFEPSKWSDWAASVGLPVHFTRIRDLNDGKRASRLLTARARLKDSLVALGAPLQTPHRPPSKRWEIYSAKQALLKLASDGDVQLSAAGNLCAAIGRVQDAVERLLRDKASGMYMTG